MEQIDKSHMAVDRSSYSEIKGAESVDIDNNSAVVVIRDLDGKEKRETRTFPAGITVVQRR